MASNLQSNELNEQLFELVKSKLVEKIRHMAIQEFASLNLRNRVERFLDGRTIRYSKFCEVFPAVEKKSIFLEDSLLKSSVSNLAAEKRNVIFSAGTSGNIPSFRLVSGGEESTNISDTEKAIVTSLFKNGSESFILINAYPFGIKTSDQVPALEIGARPQILKSVLKQLVGIEKSILVLCQPNIAGDLLRDRNFLQILPYQFKDKIKFVLGGSWHSKYLDLRISKNFSTKSVSHISSYGAAEVGLGIGLADKEMIEKRFEKIDGLTGDSSSPLFLKIDTERYFVEMLDGKLLVTPLSIFNHLPLVRYTVGDTGIITKAGSRFVFALNIRRPEMFSVDAGLVEEIIDRHDEVFYSTTGRFKIVGNKLFLECIDNKCSRDVTSFFYDNYRLEIETTILQKNLFDSANLDFSNKWYRYNEF